MSIVWIILLALAGIVFGGLITFWLTKRFRDRRVLSCYLLGFDSTFKATEWIKDQVRIKYKNKAVKTLERIQIVLKNTGNKSIEKKGIFEPIKIVLKGDGKIIEVKRHSSSFQGYEFNQTEEKELEVEFDLIQ
jgi:hypothetical protein